MKKILVLGFGLLGGVFFGTIAGTSQSMTISAGSVVLAHPCDDQECANTITCEDNPGGDTRCKYEDEFPFDCVTEGCL